VTPYRANIAVRNITLLSETVAKLRAVCGNRCANILADTLRETMAITEEEMRRKVTVREAAEMTGLSPATIRRWVKLGKLKKYGGDGERIKVCYAELPVMGIDLLSAIQKLKRLLP